MAGRQMHMVGSRQAQVDPEDFKANRVNPDFLDSGEATYSEDSGGF
jgi:hypothetical protein